MADESTKKLLVKLGISTKEWQSAVADIKKKLKDIQTQAMKDSQDRLKGQKTELDGTKQQIADQQKLRAEAQAMAAVDKAKEAWQQKQNAAIKSELLVTQQATAEIKKQQLEETAALKLEQESLKIEQLKLKVQQQQTAEQERQQKKTVPLPSASNVSGIRTSVQNVTSPQVISAIQTEALQKVIAEERQKLAIQEAQLNVLRQNQAARKIDLDAVGKEIAQEKSKLVLLEQQLRARLAQENELALEERRKAGLPTASGVSTARASTMEAASLQLSKEQATILEKHVVEERAKLAIQEAQLRVLKMAGDVRKADVTVLEKEIAQERARLAVQEAQVRAARVHMAEPGGGEGGGGFLGGALLSLGGGLFGGGLPAMMTAGVTAGMLLEKVLEKLGETVRDVGKELLNAAGEAGQLEEQFIKLANREGENPEELMSKLTLATRGLVEQEQLFRVSNNFMSGSLKLSGDEMVRLTQMTLDLSRATGKDATQAMNALIRASLTGQTRMLAMVTGIDRAQLAVKGLGTSIDPVVRKQLELHTVMDAMSRKLAEVGTPMTTIKDLFQQVHVVQTTFIEDLAFSITHSDSFSKVIQTVSKWLMNVTPSLLEFAHSVGDRLGSAFESIQPTLKEFWSLLSSIWSIAGSLSTALVQLSDALSKLGGSADATHSKLTAIGIGFSSLSASLAPATFAVKELSLSLSLLVKMFDAVKNKSIEQATAALKDFSDQSHKALKDMNEGVFGNKFDNMHQRQERKFGSRTNIGTAGEPNPRKNLDQSLAKNREKLASEIAQAVAKIRLDARLAELEDESTAEKEKYDAGLETLRQYVDKERAIHQSQHEARLQEIQQEEKAKLAALVVEARGQQDPVTGEMVGGMDPTQQAQKARLIKLQSQEKVDQENRRQKTEDHQLDQQLLQDEIAARRTFVEAINKITQEGVAERKKINETEFKDGVIGADSYLASQKDLIQKEYDLRVQALHAEADAQKNNANELAKVRVQLVEAVIEKEKQLAELEDRESQIRLEAIKKRYDAAQSLAQIDVEVGQARGDTGQTVVGLETQQDLTTRYLQQLQAERQRLEETGKEFTQDWVDVNVQIGQAVQQQIRLNKEIAQAKDWAGPLGKIFGSIASELGGVLGEGATGVLQSIAKSMEGLSATLQKRAAAGVTQSKGTWDSIKDLFRPVAVATDKAKSAMEIFNDGLKTSQTKVLEFAQGFGDSINGLSGNVGKAGDSIQSVTQVFTNAADTSSQQLVALADAAQQAAAKLAGIQAPQQQGDQLVSSDTVDGGDAPQVDTELSPVPDQIPEDASGGGGGSAFGEMSGFDEFFSMVDQAGGKISDFAKTLQDSGTASVASFASKLGAVMGKVAPMISGVMQTAGAIFSAKSTAGGVLSGGMSGMQTGMMFGPWGAAIGGAIGAVMGGLMGHKAAQAQKEADEIKGKLDSIKEGVANGSMTIGGAIQTLKTQVQPQIRSMEHGSKAEQKQAEELQKQYIQQLTQLLEQQKQLMDQLVQELGVLDAPTAYQSIMQSLEGIIAKYKEFASAAAGDTQKVAMATDWLKKSLQQYADTLQDKVNDANEQAIQDALHLNDLLQQRQDIMNAAAQQEYDIMTQGVMARQMSPAQSKMQQMGAVEANKDKQLDAIDEETKLTQYKVDSESKIFGLAKDRMGLEQQMLALQEHATDKQMADVQAMMQAVAKLDAALSGGSLPKSLLDALGGVDVNALADLLGIPESGIGPSGQGQPFIENMPPIYEEMIAVMKTVPGYSDFEDQMTKAAGTPFGSSARLAIQKEIDFYGHGPFGHPLMDAGLIDPKLARNDPNWLGFYNWILSGMQAASPGQDQGFKEGGPVLKTGKALVHAGEWVVPEASVSPIRQFLRWVTDNPDELQDTSVQKWLMPPATDDGGLRRPTEPIIPLRGRPIQEPTIPLKTGPVTTPTVPLNSGPSGVDPLTGGPVSTPPKGGLLPEPIIPIDGGPEGPPVKKPHKWQHRDEYHGKWWQRHHPLGGPDETPIPLGTPQVAYEDGGPVARTTSALVHQGEWVVPERSVEPIRGFLKWVTDNPEQLRGKSVRWWMGTATDKKAPFGETPIPLDGGSVTTPTIPLKTGPAVPPTIPRKGGLLPEPLIPIDGGGPSGVDPLTGGPVTTPVIPIDGGPSGVDPIKKQHKWKHRDEYHGKWWQRHHPEIIPEPIIPLGGPSGVDPIIPLKSGPSGMLPSLGGGKTFEPPIPMGADPKTGRNLATRPRRHLASNPIPNLPDWVIPFVEMATGTQFTGQNLPSLGMPRSMPAYEEGGPVADTGTALVHQGEWVVPKASAVHMQGFLQWVTDNPEQLQAPMMKRWLSSVGGPGGRKEEVPPNSLTPTVEHSIPLDGGPVTGGGPVGTPDRGTGLSGIDVIGNRTIAARLDHESQIFSLAHSRVAMEMDLITAQSRFASLEMQRLDATRKLYEEMQNGGIGVTSLEGAFSKLYELRGRYGSAGFNREQL